MTDILFRVQEHIEELATDALASEPTKVVFGYAEAKELCAVFGGTAEENHRLLGGPQPPVDVDYTVDLIFEVLANTGKNMKPATVRCFEIKSLVEAAVRGDHTLGGLSWNALLKKSEHEFFQTDKSQGCRIRTTLAGNARI